MFLQLFTNAGQEEEYATHTAFLSSVSQLFSKRSQRNDENGHFLSTEIGIVSHCFLLNWRSS